MKLRILTAVALATLVASPAVAAKRTRVINTAPVNTAFVNVAPLGYSNIAVVDGSKVVADPDPNIRTQLYREYSGESIEW